MHPLTPILVNVLPLSPFSICNGPWHPLYSAYVLDSPLEQPLSRSSLVFPLVLNPQLHTPCTSSPLGRSKTEMIFVTEWTTDVRARCRRWRGAESCTPGTDAGSCSTAPTAPSAGTAAARTRPSAADPDTACRSPTSSTCSSTTCARCAVPHRTSRSASRPASRTASIWSHRAPRCSGSGSTSSSPAPRVINSSDRTSHRRSSLRWTEVPPPPNSGLLFVLEVSRPFRRKRVIAPEAARRYAPHWWQFDLRADLRPSADGSAVRTPLMAGVAKLQAASVPIAYGSCAPRGAAPWDRRTDCGIV